ncbi:MepB family protein [Priestia filamentosa]|uniref:MepB family protein n=1 Tax=Priestia filamentosa TaxID=1402861 RepID=UPI00397958F9
MNNFFTALTYVNKMIYESNRLTVTSVQEEKQNSKYGAGTFQLSSKTVRFRVANITPTKVGQFVALWEKDENNKNQPYLYEEAPDLLVITTFKNEREFGQFVFPKEVLLKQNILSSTSTKGKMAIRVYPSWDSPTSKQAIKTQKWQLPYFVDMCNPNKLPLEKIIELYSL